MKYLVLLALLIGCSPTLAPTGDTAIEGLSAPVLAPANNPTTEARVTLGRMLFWDPLLSGDRDVACATCHHPAFDYADGRARSLGTGEHEIARNAPTVLDTAFNGWTSMEVPVAPELAPMFWDRRESSLERQALGPLLSEGEMRGPHFSEAAILDEISARLTANAAYRALFLDAYGTSDVDADRITQAIAAFERTLVSRDTSFDRFMAGDDAALDLSQRRGLVAFYDAGCASCHAGPMFSDYQLHHLGVHEVDAAGASTDAFRTPSLRHVTRTAPYLHDGSIATLEEVIAFYRNVDRNLDPDLGPLQPVGARQTTDLIHFLEALSDGSFDRTIPERVPSGLPVGGR